MLLEDNVLTCDKYTYSHVSQFVRACCQGTYIVADLVHIFSVRGTSIYGCVKRYGFEIRTRLQISPCISYT